MKTNHPDSGTQKFNVGMRVFIPAIGVVGTVLAFVDDEYLVRYVNIHGKPVQTHFHESELIEQPELPFQEKPF